MKLQKNLVLCLLLLAPLTYAEWTLDGEGSSVSFVTTKATSIAEVNQFDRLQGSVDNGGKADLIIDLTSVNTGIPVRDGRMQEMLFETNMYPKAVLTTSVPIAQLAKLQAGQKQSLELDSTLDLHGVKMPLQASVLVVKLADGSLLVSNTKPLVVNASSVDLAEGVEKLREIAGLPNISLSVVVNFELSFKSN